MTDTLRTQILDMKNLLIKVVLIVLVEQVVMRSEGNNIMIIREYMSNVNLYLTILVPWKYLKS